MRLRAWFGFAGAAVVFFVTGRQGVAQVLRFGNHREVVLPKKGTIVAGPYSLTVGFTQTAGYWHTRGGGTGTDYLRYYRRGAITGEGSDFPLTSTLTLRNYLAITPRMDLDFSVTAHYEHYPLDTQDDVFYVSATDEGIYGTLSSEVVFSPFVRGRLYDNFQSRTDYVDLRGLVDRYGGERYVFMENTAGFDLDWRLAPDKNVPFSISRMDHIPRDKEFQFREFVSYRVSGGYEQEIFQGVGLGVSFFYTSYDFAASDRLDFEQKGATLNLNLVKGIEAGLPVSEASTLSLSIGYAHGYSYGTRERRLAGESEGASEVESNVATITGNATLKTYLRRDLTHWLSYTRYIEPGYVGGSYVSDRVSYVLAWTPVLTEVKFSTAYSAVDARGLESDYRDWTTRLGLKAPFTAFGWLDCFTQYDHRWNATPVIVTGMGRDELYYDYTTWVTRIGGGVSLAKHLDLHVWGEHAERMSKAVTLDYTRDTVAAILVYRIVFD